MGCFRYFFPIIGIISLITSSFVAFFSVNRVEAAGLEMVMVRLDRLSASTATGGTVCATPYSAATEVSVTVAFPANFTVDSTASNWSVTTTNLPPGATAWPGIGTATSVSGQEVTFPSDDLTPSTFYCFNFSGTSTLATGTVGDNQTGTVTTQASGPTEIDSASYALSVVSSDQIVISATVPATFSFALSDNTDSFVSDLSTTTTSTSGQTVSISTNAANGWIAWVKSMNAALDSSSTGASIGTAGSVDDTPTDLSGTTGYVLDVDITTDSAIGTGTVTQANGYGAEYSGTNTTSGGALSMSFQPIAASDGTTDGDVLTLIERARVSAVQAAATDYTDTLTVIAAGRF